MKAMMFLLAFVMIAGCSRATTAPPATSEPPAASQENTQAAEESPPEKETTAISEWDQIVAAAKQEGKVVVAAHTGAAYRDALMAFNQAYPEIDIEFSGIVSSEFGSKVVTEHAVGQYLWDVHVGGASSIFTQMIPGGVVDVFPRDLPETAAGASDGKWMSGFDEGLVDKEHNYAYAFSANARHAVYINKDFIDEGVFASGEDLLKPELKGKISWYDPTIGGPGNAVASSFLRNYGEDFLRDVLTKQEVAITRDFRQQIEWLVRGRYPVAVGTESNVHRTLQEFRDNGLGLNVEPAGDEKMSELSGGYGVMIMLKHAPNPNAAKVFINWLLSKEGQTSWIENTQTNSRRLDVPPGSPAQYPEPNVNYAFDAKEEFLEFRLKATAVAKEVVR